MSKRDPGLNNYLRFLLTASENSLPALKRAMRLAGILTDSPVLGFLPIRGLRTMVSKVPKPIRVMFSPEAT